VYVVPGYGGDAASVSSLTAALEKAGRTVHVVVTPQDGRALMVDGAAALNAALPKEETFDLVGFSAGGIVIRTWIAVHGTSGRARHVVLIGAPSHGSAALKKVADCKLGCLDLLPGSGLLKRINALDETPEGPDYVSFWTANDTAVTPPSSAVVTGARNVRVQDVCRGKKLGHLELVTDADVLSMVVTAAAHGQAALFACGS